MLRCPNCGTTMDLESRRKTDFNLIIRAVGRKATTFTEILKFTRLPRKTLSLRLKELRERGLIVKNEHTYQLSKTAQRTFSSSPFKRPVFLDADKFKTSVILIILIVAFYTSGYVMALLSSQPPQNTQPEVPILGTFKMNIKVNDVADLKAWSILIDYNESELKVLNVTPGDFWNLQFPWFLSKTDLQPNLLVLAGAIPGEGQGPSGSGTLATIQFGYFLSDWEEPQFLLKWAVLETGWMNSHGNYFDFSSETLTLELVK